MLPRSSALASRHLLRPASSSSHSPSAHAPSAARLACQQSTSSHQQHEQGASSSAFGGVAKAVAAALGVSVGVAAYKKLSEAELPAPMVLQAKAIEGITPEAEQEILHKENRYG